MNVKIKRLHPAAVIPQYAHDYDAGVDLVATEDVIVEPGATVKVPTGIAISLPAGYEAQVRPRSGITLKTKLRVALGTIDAGYVGEIGVIIDNIAQKDYEVDSDLEGGYELYTVCHNALHTIDNSGYTPQGNILTDDSVPVGTYIIRKGDKIAQLVITQIEHAVFTEVDTLEETARGDGGFGSSGVKVEDSYAEERRRQAHIDSFADYLAEEEARKNGKN